MVLTFDFETSKESNLPWMKGAYAVSIALKILGEDQVVTYLLNHESVPYKPPPIKEIQAYFDKATLIIGQNIKFDLHWLRKLGISFDNCKLYDTMVAEYLISGQNKLFDFSLENLSKHYCIPDKIDKVKMYWDAGYETAQIPLDILVPYGEQDVLNTEAIYCLQQEKIEQAGLQKLVFLRCESLRVTQEIEWNGMLIDTKKTSTLIQEYTEKINSNTNDLNNFVKDSLYLYDIPFSLSSNDHLSAILFGGEIKYDGKETVERVLKSGEIKVYERNAKLTEKTQGLGFKPAKGTETKKEGYYQTDVNQINGLKAKNNQQKWFLELLRETSKLDKMKSTYFERFTNEAVNDIFHPRLNEVGTWTGRYSSNIQNVPRSGTGEIKSIFISRYP